MGVVIVVDSGTVVVVTNRVGAGGRWQWSVAGGRVVVCGMVRVSQGVCARTDSHLFLIIVVYVCFVRRCRDTRMVGRYRKVMNVGRRGRLQATRKDQMSGGGGGVVGVSQGVLQGQPPHLF
ncbi:hypothetical protein Tco_1001185 [Tanacetum coccineum]